MSRFIVISKQRSGTGFLETLLNAHPNIFCTGELLLLDRGDSFPKIWLEAMRQDEKYLVYKHATKLFRDYFNRFFLSHGEPHVGFDIKYDQMNTLANLHELLNEYDVRIIHLIRRNYLKTYISLLVNIEKQKQGRKAHDLKKYDPIRIRINTGEKLLGELRKRKEEIEHFSEFIPAHFPTLTLFYEDFFDKTEESQTMKPDALRSIFDFLGEANRKFDLESPIRKTNPSRIEEIVTNYDELVATLEGTEFEELLELEDVKPVMQYEEWMRVGQSHFMRGDVQKAIEVFESMVKAHPQSAEVMNNLGVCWWKNGDTNRAKDWILRAIKIDPSENEYRENLYQLERS